MKHLVVLFLIFFVSCSVFAQSNEKKKNVYFAYRSFNTERETLKTLHGFGINTVCFFAANTLNSMGTPYCQYPPIWLGIGHYDFKQLDVQIADLLSANPEAKLLCMIDLNTPPWLTRRFAFDSFSEISTAASSNDWRNETSKYLEAFLKYTEEKHGDKIVAYILSGGGTSEWYEYPRGRGSNIKNAAWRSWCKRNGLPENNDPPTPLQLAKTSFEDFLYDPAKEPQNISYWRFHNEVIVDAIIEFAQKTKKIIPKSKEIGVFFGYIYVSDSCITTFGHLDYERLYAIPEIDFFISPGIYHDRGMGGGSGSQLMLGTLQFQGKQYMHEADHRTHTVTRGLTSDKTKDQISDTAMLKREAAFAIINHTSIWWFDMWGGFYQTEETLHLLKQLKIIWEQWKNDNAGSIAEVLLVADPQSAYYIKERHPFALQAYSQMQNKLNRLGAPYDTCSFNDLSKIDLNRYKMIVFPGTFEITPQRIEVLKKYVFNNNRTVLWLYAPGIIDGKTLNPDFVELLTGTKYKTPGLNKVKKDGWKSVYIHSYAETTPAVLKTIAKESGVTIYCDEEVPVFANERLLAIHVAKGGKKKITLPFRYDQIIDIFNKKIVAENVNEFEYEFLSPDTILFEMKRKK
jgi:hypothetical protein